MPLNKETKPNKFLNHIVGVQIKHDTKIISSNYIWNNATLNNHKNIKIFLVYACKKKRE